MRIQQSFAISSLPLDRAVIDRTLIIVGGGMISRPQLWDNAAQNAAALKAHHEAELSRARDIGKTAKVMASSGSFELLQHLQIEMRTAPEMPPCQGCGMRVLE